MFVFVEMGETLGLESSEEDWGRRSTVQTPCRCCTGVVLTLQGGSAAGGQGPPQRTIMYSLFTPLLSWLHGMLAKTPELPLLWLICKTELEFPLVGRIKECLNFNKDWMGKSWTCFTVLFWKCPTWTLKNQVSLEVWVQYCYLLLQYCYITK